MTPPELGQLQGDDLRRAAGLLSQANHDVAKYMAVTARNVDPRALSAEETQWLRKDLLQTDGHRPAWKIWREISCQVACLVADSTIAALDQQMDDLARMVQQNPWPPADLSGLVAQILKTSQAIVELNRRLRQRLAAAAGQRRDEVVR
jgi:hypothetical protein